jgi:hypothetical protein
MVKLKISIKQLGGLCNGLHSYSDINLSYIYPEKINFKCNMEYKHISEKNTDFCSPNYWQTLGYIMSISGSSDDCFVILRESDSQKIYEAAEKYNKGRMNKINIDDYYKL